MTRVLVLNYDNGNANSVLRALDAAGAEGNFSDHSAALDEARAIILPGVGHAGRAMAALDAKGLRQPLERAALDRRVPILGICLGMQIMTEHLAEGNCAGLGWVGGRAEAMTISDRVRYKLPHIGWNDVIAARDSSLMDVGGASSSFYFCHKYTVVGLDRADGVSTFRYETDHVAAFERGNLTGVQFHPEKSHDAGYAFFRRWLAQAT